ncbi:MAG: hypothetical protein JO083_05975 [Candidatus Eremiobacteraeota bacterium]|nr:hypothetical protein [Candidatus Eremiobacteraeota bacterium]
MRYTLDIEITPAGLEAIYAAGQAVTLVKNVRGAVPGLLAAPIPVAWIVLQPMQHNTLAWCPRYRLFATTISAQPGETIVLNSVTATDALPGWVYVFRDGYFTGTPGCGIEYRLHNMVGSCAPGAPTYSFGLAQYASVNSVSVLAAQNALPVLYNEDAGFTGSESISVFLGSTTPSGTYVLAVPDNALTVALDGRHPSAELRFNDATNTFYVS